MNQLKINTCVSSETTEKNSVREYASLAKNLPIEFRKVGSISELFPLLSNPSYHTDYISINVEDLESQNDTNAFDIVNSLKTLIKCTVRRDNKPCIKPVRRNTLILGAASYDTPPEIIKKVIPYVDGIIIKCGGPWTIDDFIKDQEKILSGDLSIPPEIQKILKPKKINNTLKNNSQETISLTSRQTQILNLVVSRGASNKVIAKMLNLSESTVKLHVSAILKKHGLRNRTQLVVFSTQNKDNKCYF